METTGTTVIPLQVVQSQSVQETIIQKTNAANLNNEDEPFYLIDIGDVIRKHKTWLSLLPRIQPFYAMKCNPDLGIVATLVRLGAGLDVASAAEIKIASSLGAKEENVIYANTCKGISHLKVAVKEGIKQMTFDSEVELHKIKRIVPDARLVLRLLVDDSGSKFHLGMKSGVPFSRVSHLLEVSQELGLNVIGVSFHIGSDGSDPAAYTKAIEKARKVFDIAKELGLELKLLDIGGGYPGEANELFENMCTAINQAINVHFPVDSGIRIIGEPGKYYACSSSILVVNVIGRRLRYPDDEVQIKGNHDNDMGDMECMYHINDGVAGSFMDALILKIQYIPKKLVNINDKCHKSSVWGPTCSPLDCTLNDCSLPEMETGEWVYYEDMGAYNASTSTTFNGFRTTDRHYFIHEKYWNEFKKELSCNFKEFK